MPSTTPVFTFLPTHKSFYSDFPISLDTFLNCARTALSSTGFSHIRTVNKGTDCEKELWGNLQAARLATASKTLKVAEIDWLTLRTAGASNIAKALKVAARSKKPLSPHLPMVRLLLTILDDTVPTCYIK